MSENDTPNAVGEQSPRQKAPGRLAHIARVNEERKRRREQGETAPGELGGRPIEHGEYALTMRYKAGLDANGPLYPIILKHRDDFLGDLGGAANASAKESTGCEYLGFLKVMFGLLVAQFSGAKRMSRQEMIDLNAAVTRNAATFAQIAKQLGFPRRQVEADRGVTIVRRWCAPEPDAKPHNENEQGSGGT